MLLGRSDRQPAKISSIATAACIRDPRCHRLVVVAHRAKGAGAPENSREAVRRRIRAMVRILDRHLLRELGGPFAIGVGVFTFFLVIDRIYQLTDDLVTTKNVPVLGITRAAPVNPRRARGGRAAP